MKRFHSFVGLSLSLFLGACAVPNTDPVGAIEVTSSSPTAQNVITTSDGWSIKADKLVVHVTQMTVTGADDVLTASAAAVIADFAKPGSPSLLSATNRKARVWERFAFEIGPAAEGDVVLAGDVAEADVTRMQKEALSILFEGTATFGDQKKTFSWALTTDTLYSDCPAVVVPPNDTGAVDIVFRADVFFADDPARPDLLQFQPFADADADGDGAITLEELAAPSGLGAALEENARRIVGSVHGTGSCTSAPAATAE